MLKDTFKAKFEIKALYITEINIKLIKVYYEPLVMMNYSCGSLLDG